MNRTIVIALCLMLLAPATLAQDGSGSGMGGSLALTNTSLLVLGDTSTPPLDEGSLNALFTPAFMAEVREELQKSLGGEDLDLRVHAAQFLYVSEGKKDSGARVAQIVVQFADVPEELLPKLSIEAPKLVLEHLKKHVEDYLQVQRQMEASQLEERQIQLSKLAAQLKEEIRAILLDYEQTSSLVSLDELQKYYNQLQTRQREDRLKNLSIVAERRAVEKQVEQLRAQMESMQVHSPLLDELKANVDSRQQVVEKLKQTASENSEELKQLKLGVEQAERALSMKMKAFAAGNAAPSEVEALKAKLLEAQYRVAAAEANSADRVGQAEAALVEGKIEYLRKKEELTQAQFGTRLQALNDMLSQWAIEADATAARHEAIVAELESVARIIQDQSKAELERKNQERAIGLRESQLERIQHELFQLNLKAEQTPPQEFTILPWGG